MFLYICASQLRCLSASTDFGRCNMAVNCVVWLLFVFHECIRSSQCSLYHRREKYAAKKKILSHFVCYRNNVVCLKCMPSEQNAVWNGTNLYDSILIQNNVNQMSLVHGWTSNRHFSKFVPLKVSIWSEIQRKKWINFVHIFSFYPEFQFNLHKFILYNRSIRTKKKSTRCFIIIY